MTLKKYFNQQVQITIPRKDGLIILIGLIPAAFFIRWALQTSRTPEQILLSTLLLSLTWILLYDENGEHVKYL